MLLALGHSFGAADSPSCAQGWPGVGHQVPAQLFVAFVALDLQDLAGGLSVSRTRGVRHDRWVVNSTYYELYVYLD